MSIKEIDVWLDVGREGRCFTYCDRKKLGIDVGDIVLVTLKGRPMHGLVVKVNDPILSSENCKGRFTLTNVEGLIQKAAVDHIWREWIESIAA